MADDDSFASARVKLSLCIFDWSLMACKIELIFVSRTIPPITISSVFGRIADSLSLIVVQTQDIKRIKRAS
jgi:hypothetical protein